MNKNGEHLSLEDKIRIEESLANGASRTAIAQILSIEKSTIYKKVQKRRKNTARPGHSKTKSVNKSLVNTLSFQIKYWTIHSCFQT